MRFRDGALVRFGSALAAMFALLPLWAATAQARDWNYFLIPAIANSKNDGVDVGIIAPFIFNDKDGRITQIIAPMYVHNEFLGSRVTLNLFKYPKRGEEITFLASYTESIERKFLGTYRNLYIAQGRYSFEAGAGFFKNATARFFGIGATSREENETNYTDRELYGYASAGIYVGPGQRVLFTQRVRNVELQPGGIPSLPFTQSVFPSIPGTTGGTTVFGNRLGFLSDTRDDTVTPTTGSFFAAYAEVAPVFTAARTISFSKYGLEYRILIPNQTKRYTFAFRGKVEATLGGEDIPFFERSLLGGQNSLRGFGVGRFVDDHSIVLNFEERIQLFHLRLFGTIAEIETAPFLDIGKVMSTFGYRLLSRYEINPGIGFRAIARPNVVGRVDVATSRDGHAIFAGLDFPF
jgi:outer membrane protein assembly factor BamA